jgi:hypothetical protein
MKNIRRWKTFESLDGKSEVEEIIGRDCKKFLEEFGDIRFYRGFTDAGNWRLKSGLPIYKIPNRKSRPPKDTRIEISEIFDDQFEKEFGVRPRQEAAFASRSFVGAQSYGEPMLFFPIGDYRYLYNPDIIDLYTHIEDTPWNLGEEYWEMLYGPDSENGTWCLGDQELSSDYWESIKMVKKIKKYSRYTNSQISRFITWKPDMSINQWNKQRESDMLDDIDLIVSGYKTSGLADWIKTTGDKKKSDFLEVMFLCSEYYLIDANIFI